MINIIRETDYKKQILRFTCWCGCIFDTDEYKAYSEGYNLKATVFCPCCGCKVCEFFVDDKPVCIR